MISTTPPHLRCGLFQPKPRSAINSPSCFSRRRFSAWSSSANSTISTASGSPRTAVPMIGLEHRDLAPQRQHGAVDQFHRDRAQFHQMLGRIHRLVKTAEMADAQHLVADHRPQLQFDLRGEGQRAFRSHQQMRQIVRRIARHQRVEIVAADPALHFREFFGDLGGLALRRGRACRETARGRCRRDSPRRNAAGCRRPAPRRSTACCRAWCRSAANGRRRNCCRPCRRWWRARRWRRRPGTTARVF